MPFYDGPVFRKKIIPWYRSTTTCVVIMVAMLATFFFGLAGLGVAQEIARYRRFSWVPLLLMLMSAVVMVTMAVRLLRRYTSRSRQDGTWMLGGQ